MALARFSGVAGVLVASLVSSAAAEPAKFVTIVGTLTDEGAECQTLRGDDGQLYTLSGDVTGFGPGDRVRVRGKVAELSFCMQGTTIAVRSIKGRK